MRLGPVVATPTRCTLLVAPYALEELGELLYAQDWVPSSLRFHGEGGYVALPPSRTGAGRVRWERAPVAADEADRVSRSGGVGARTGLVRGVPWLPRVERVLDVVVEASTTAPGSGTSLAY